MATTYSDRCILGESLGGGGRGDVFLASDRSGQYPNRVALKHLRHRNRADRFIREIEAIQRVDHDHVVKNHSQQKSTAQTNLGSTQLRLPSAISHSAASRSKNKLDDDSLSNPSSAPISD